MLRANMYNFINFDELLNDTEVFLRCIGDKVIQGNKNYSSNFSVLYSMVKERDKYKLPKCVDLDFNGKLKGIVVFHHGRVVI